MLWRARPRVPPMGSLIARAAWSPSEANTIAVQRCSDAHVLPDGLNSHGAREEVACARPHSSWIAPPRCRRTRRLVPQPVLRHVHESGDIAARSRVAVAALVTPHEVARVAWILSSSRAIRDRSLPAPLRDESIVPLSSNIGCPSRRLSDAWPRCDRSPALVR
jgi:hypothetical protein